MDSLFLANLSSPPLLFFFLGAAAAFLRSDLEIPTQVAKFLSLYLLFAIGFKAASRWRKARWTLQSGRVFWQPSRCPS